MPTATYHGPAAGRHDLVSLPADPRWSGWRWSPQLPAAQHGPLGAFLPPVTLPNLWRERTLRTGLPRRLVGDLQNPTSSPMPPAGRPLRLLDQLIGQRQTPGLRRWEGNERTLRKSPIHILSEDAVTGTLSQQNINSPNGVTIAVDVSFFRQQEVKE